MRRSRLVWASKSTQGSHSSRRPYRSAHHPHAPPNFTRIKLRHMPQQCLIKEWEKETGQGSVGAASRPLPRASPSQCSLPGGREAALASRSREVGRLHWPAAVERQAAFDDSRATAASRATRTSRAPVQTGVQTDRKRTSRCTLGRRPTVRGRRTLRRRTHFAPMQRARDMLGHSDSKRRRPS